MLVLSGLKGDPWLRGKPLAHIVLWHPPFLWFRRRTTILGVPTKIQIFSFSGGGGGNSPAVHSPQTISSGDIPNSTTPSQNPRGTPRDPSLPPVLLRMPPCKAKLRVTAQSRPDRGPTAQSGPDRGPTVISGPDRPVVQPQPPIL